MTQITSSPSGQRTRVLVPLVRKELHRTDSATRCCCCRQYAAAAELCVESAALEPFVFRGLLATCLWVSIKFLATPGGCHVTRECRVRVALHAAAACRDWDTCKKGCMKAWHGCVGYAEQTDPATCATAVPGWILE